VVSKIPELLKAIMTHRRRFLFCALGGAGLAAIGWRRETFSAEPSPGDLLEVRRSSHAMGSQVHCTVYAATRAQGEEAIDAAFAAIDRVESVMSLYRPDSQLCQLNRSGTLSRPDPDLLDVLQLAAEISRRSDGAFDITVQPLWELHARHARLGSHPSPQEIKDACQYVNWQAVHIEEEGIWLEGGAQITLNGIAQGHAADAACRALRTHGILHAILDAGEIRPLGRHAERNHWQVGIQHPRQRGDLLGLARLDGRCMATSGDYETTFTRDHRSHHLFNPRTGHAALACASVSVMAPTAAQADALSTACFVLGIERGMELIRDTPQADALFVARDGQLTRSEHFPLQLS
jgi:FAD:protein FMN transferase